MRLVTGGQKHCDTWDSEAHAQVPSNQPVLLVFSQKWGKPVQKQLLHRRLPKVLYPATKPSRREGNAQDLLEAVLTSRAIADKS